MASSPTKHAEDAYAGAAGDMLGASTPTRRRTAGQHGGPGTPELFHPAAAPAESPTAAAAARIGVAARTAAGAAAAGFAAARDGVKKLQHHVVAAPVGPGAAPQAGMGDRASDMGLAGLADAAGQALHDLPSLGAPSLGSWRQRVKLTKRLAAALCTATLAYAFLLAPNSLGLRADLALLSRGFSDNALACVLFNLLGLFPFLLNCLMWPTLRSAGGKPAMWPFLALSYVAGAFALLSYLARWRPRTGPGRSPRVAPARLAGSTVWLQRQHEGRLMPALVTASIAALLALCLAASPATWAHLGFLLSHSKAVNVMALDLSLLTLMSPLLVVADARARGVRLAQNPAGALLLGLAMLAVPLVGPGVYLLWRPVAGASQAEGTRVGLHSLSVWVSSLFGAKGRGENRLRAAAAAAQGRAVRGGRQLRQGTAAAAAAAHQAGSSAVAAGSNAAANVVAAAQVPLPSEQQVGRGVGAAAAGTGFAAGAVAGSLQRGWARLKRGAVRFMSGGYPDLATAARTGSVDEVFVDYSGAGADTDSSDSTEHQHSPPGHHPRLNFPAHSTLGRFAYFITSLTPGGGRELLFADDYNETEADDDHASDLDDDDLTLDDAATDAAAGYAAMMAAAAAGSSQQGNGDDGEEEEIEDDVTFELGGGESEGKGQEQEQGARRGGYRRAKAVALQRLAEYAHLQHPRMG